MPAAIANDGKVDLFASHRETAWHGLGNVFTHEVTDYRQMLVEAGLSGWNIHQEDAILPPGVDRFVTPTKHIIATIGEERIILGTSGDRYEIVQNEDAFAFLQSLSDGSRWETAGAIKDGRVVFGSLAVDRELVLDPTGVADVVKAYLLVTTSHDGSGGVAGGRTPVRVVCQNTLNVAMGNIAQSFKFRHTMTVADRMAKGAVEWRKTHAYFDAFDLEAQALFAKKVTTKQYVGAVDSLFPKPEEDKKGAESKWETNREKYMQAWNGKPNAGIKGTAWGMFNALTEANQWGRGIRKGKSAADAARGQENFFAAGAGFDIPTNAFRAKALVLARTI